MDKHKPLYFINLFAEYYYNIILHTLDLIHTSKTRNKIQIMIICNFSDCFNL